MRRTTAALLLAVVWAAAPPGAVCAHAQAAVPFEVLPRPVAPRQSHRAAWVCAAAGVGLIGASFPLSQAADRRYAEYLSATTLADIRDRWDATVRTDHLASGALLGGEALLATAVYLRFIRRPHEARLSVDATPSRCALSYRF